MKRLYLCPTLLHLFNCIVLEHSFQDHENADIWLSDATDFSEKVEPLRRCGLFREVHFLAIQPPLEALKAMPEKNAKQDIMKRPLSYFTEVAQLLEDPERVYDTVYTNQDSYFSKAVYYCMVEKGQLPVIHFVSEGTASYAIDLSNTAKDWMPHEYYGEAAYVKRLGELWSYIPELYSGGVETLVQKRLPSTVMTDDNLRGILRSVYGEIPAFSQKVVLFEGAFMGDSILTNEMNLFLTVAEKVGKENVIVKRHPRNPFDRWTPMGFAVMENFTVPWEIMLMDMDVSDKLLVSVASFTCLSPMEMYHKQTNAILLQPLMLGRAYFLQEAAVKVLQKSIEYFSEQGYMVRSPRSYEELDSILNYLGAAKQ